MSNIEIINGLKIFTCPECYTRQGGITDSGVITGCGVCIDYAILLIEENKAKVKGEASMNKKLLSLEVDSDNNAYFKINGEPICWITPSGELVLNEEVVTTLGTYKVGGSFPRYVLTQDNEYEIEKEQTK